MKKIFSVLVAIAMCVCLCIPAFAADDSVLGGLADSLGGSDALGGLSDSLGGLDLSGFDLEGIKESAGNLTGDLDDVDLLGTITGALGGLFSGTGSEGGANASEGSAGNEGSGTLDVTNGLSSVIGGLGDFDLTGALGSFTEGLSLDSLKELFSGLLGSLGESGVDLGGFSFGDFDIASIFSGDGAGVAGIMDTFGGVLESLGLSSDVIEGLLDNDIVNFFANLYLGITDPVEEPEAPTEAPTTEATTVATTVATTEPIHNPDMGVNDASAVIVACATITVAAAAAFVCTRKKRA